MSRSWRRGTESPGEVGEVGEVGGGAEAVAGDGFAAVGDGDALEGGAEDATQPGAGGSG